ncbi:PucR family transcriptional regulator [Streptomyces sp. A7024]|uniref:PucR family transcriptional regulator n=1 Tax=Streptomyces coryli TaxID=1128680 RepID=A0A6G4TZV6_9ACTN|nr:PucR family transcriptional regulator [Streptomyces coryli]
MAVLRARTEREWEVLLSASDELASRVPELTDRLLEELIAHSPQYDLAVPRDEHWRQIDAALRYGIEAIVTSREGTRRDLEYAAELGRCRAEQGLPLELLLYAYRHAGYLVWETLLDIVTAKDPEALPLLGHTATVIWAGTDRQTATVTDAYRATERELRRRTDERVQALLDALLAGGAEPELAQRAAAALDLPVRGRYAVVVLRGAEHGVFGEPGGMRFLWRIRPDSEVGLVALGEAAGTAELAAAVAARSAGPGGISPVVGGLTELGRARRWAELALRTVPAGSTEVVRLDRRLPAAFVVSQPELARLLVADVFGELMALEATDRAVLLETLDAWLECSGSAGRAATRLYCHRNTVFNRLRRVEQLTSRSLSRPRDLTEITLALDAYRLTGEDAVE